MDLKTFNPNGVGVDNGAYYGLPFTPEEAALVLVSAPWDVTVSYGAGTALAPDALIEASTQLDLYDASAPGAWLGGIATADIDYSLQEESRKLRADAERVIEHLEEGGAPDDERIERRLRRINEGCAAMNDNIYRQARQWLSQGKVVGLVGGDHSTPYGLIRAVAEKEGSLGILHIDAHCDLREAYEGFEFSHASIMFNVLRDLPQVSKLVQVGVRDYCDAEAERAASDGRIAMFDSRSLARAGFAGTTWAESCRRIVDELIYERTAVEGRILRDFAPNATPAQRAQIRARVDAYEALARAENPDFNKLYEMDCRLHETWFAAMDKMYLWSTLQNAHADYSRFRMLDTMTTGGLDEVIADHRNLLNAIERCDLAAFEPLVERHLYGGIRRLGSKLTKEYADFFEPENVK